MLKGGFDRWAQEGSVGLGELGVQVGLARKEIVGFGRFHGYISRIMCVFVFFCSVFGFSAGKGWRTQRIEGGKKEQRERTSARKKERTTLRDGRGRRQRKRTINEERQKEIRNDIHKKGTK